MKDANAEILKRLDMVISLLFELVEPGRKSMIERQKIQELVNRGFDVKDISNILGKSSDKISKQLYVLNLRKKVKSKNG